MRFYLGGDHAGAHSATADALAAARVLDAQVGRFPDLPAGPAGLHRLLAEVDVGRRFRLAPQARVVFGFGKYDGLPLAEVAACDAGHLRRMLTTGMLDDAGSLVEGALLAARPRLGGEQGRVGAGGGTEFIGTGDPAPGGRAGGGNFGYAKISVAAFPATSVSRKSRPA